MTKERCNNEAGDKEELIDSPCSNPISRPRNGDEVVKALANGNTVEVPNGYGTKTLGYLQQILEGSWGADCETSKFNKGWFSIEPHDNCVKLCLRYIS